MLANAYEALHTLRFIHNRASRQKLNWWIWFFKQILFPDWLPERVGWAHLAHFDPTQKIKCMERTYNVRNSCTISAQKATEDSQMSYINVRIRPFLNFPRPWKWYCKIAWLSRYFLNRRTLHDLYVNRSVLLVCYKLHLKRKLRMVHRGLVGQILNSFVSATIRLNT